MTLIALGAASTSDEAYQLPLDQVVNLNDIFNDANVKIVTSGSTPTTVIGKDTQAYQIGVSLFALQVLGNEHRWYVVTLYANGERKGSVDCYPGWVCTIETKKEPNPRYGEKKIWMDQSGVAHLYQAKGTLPTLRLELEQKVLQPPLDAPDPNGAEIGKAPDGSILFSASRRWSYNHEQQYN
ncbi:hypothetical protein PoMZ_05140, partial [Pyricularia oryzae]